VTVSGKEGNDKSIQINPDTFEMRTRGHLLSYADCHFSVVSSKHPIPTQKHLFIGYVRRKWNKSINMTLMCHAVVGTEWNNAQ